MRAAMQKPQQLDVGDVLSTAMRIMESRAGLFVALIALIAVPQILIGGLSTVLLSDPPIAPPGVDGTPSFFSAIEMLGVGVILWVLFSAMVAFVISGFQVAAFTEVALSGVREDRGITGDVLRAALNRTPTMLACFVITSLALVPVLVPPYTAAAAAIVGTGDWTVLLGFAAVALFFVAIPAVLFLMVSLCLAPAAIMVEGCSALESLRRSWEVTKGNRLMLFLLLLAMLVVFLVVACCIGMPFGIAAATVQYAGGPAIVPQLIQNIINSLLGVVGSAFLYTTLAVAFARLTALGPKLDGEASSAVFS